MAASLDTQAAGIEEAVKYGQQARNQVMGSIVVAQQAVLEQAPQVLAQGS